MSIFYNNVIRKVIVNLFGMQELHNKYVVDEISKVHVWAIPICYSIALFMLFYVFDLPEWMAYIGLLILAILWHSLLITKIISCSYLPVDDQVSDDASTKKSSGAKSE